MLVCKQVSKMTMIFNSSSSTRKIIYLEPAGLTFVRARSHPVLSMHVFVLTYKMPVSCLRAILAACSTITRLKQMCQALLERKFIPTFKPTPQLLQTLVVYRSKPRKLVEQFASTRNSQLQATSISTKKTRLTVAMAHASARMLATQQLSST